MINKTIGSGGDYAKWSDAYINVVLATEFKSLDWTSDDFLVPKVI